VVVVIVNDEEHKNKKEQCDHSLAGLKPESSEGVNLERGFGSGALTIS
jgi:hypothetical protein